jgi:dynein heavy chain
VPADWAAAGRHVGGASLGPWLATVQQRSETLAAIAKGHRPSSYSLATLSNPQGFLAANVQEAARKRAKEGWTLDAVGIATKVLTFDREDAQARKGLDEGVYIHGLHLDGCRWDRQHGRLIEPLPRVLTSALPVVHVTAVLDDHWRQERPDTARVLESPHPTSRPSAHDLSAELSAPPGASSYACPCYKHPRRGAANFVFDIDLRTDEPVSKWVLRSVCVLTQLIP